MRVSRQILLKSVVNKFNGGEWFFYTDAYDTLVKSEPELKVGRVIGLLRTMHDRRILERMPIIENGRLARYKYRVKVNGAGTTN